MTPWLQPEVTTLTFCWRLDRLDGVTIGFTTHDRDLLIDGLPYRAAPGMLPSAISLTDGFEADTLDVSGALTDAAIRDDDLASGRWDGARLRLFAADWTDPNADIVPLARGELGDVEIRDGGFTAELRGPAALLERPVVEQTSPECRAELGDRRCRVDLCRRRSTAIVIEVIDDRAVRIDATEGEPRAYVYGRARWLDGPNSGLDSALAESEGDRLTFRDAVAYTVKVGDRLTLVEGCDKSFETCRDRFRNGANFRGEPHLAGNDLLMRYPGA